MSKITIVIVAFNREKSLKRLLESLNKVNYLHDDVTLYISIDRDKNKSIENKMVVQCANNFEWKYGEKIVDYKKQNLGLKKHILQCGDLTLKYNNIIVLEDDIVVSPMMYIYAKQAIEYYKENKEIAGLGLYSFQRNPLNNLPFIPLNDGSDVYFMQYACSWGQIWMKEKWQEFKKWYDINKNVDFSNNDRIPINVRKWGEKSWLKYHTIYTILNNKFFVYPQNGLTTNFSETGTHNMVNSFAYQCTVLCSENENIKFRFNSIKDANNAYDAFFENVSLKKLLKIDKEIECDFYGSKDVKNIENNKYLLSSQKYDYRIINKYSLQMYPYEQNIINNICGDDIYLYDLTIPNNERKKTNDKILLRYVYKMDLLSKKQIYIFSKYFIRNMLDRIIRKIKRKKNGK